MATETDKRTAALAVSRYGADPGRVWMTYQALRTAQSRGEPGDLLDLLVAQRLLSPAQADDLQLDLNGTQLNPASAGSRRPLEKGRQVNAARPAALVDKREILPASPGHHLRWLGGYRLLRRLGEGGMGAVYLGYQEKENRQVAIKVLSEQLAANQAYLDRFHREAGSGLFLNHPNLVQSLTAGKDPKTGKHFLVMEYVEGQNARGLLEQFGRLNVADAIHIILDIARALEYIHGLHFVHRDVKPDNILMTRSGLAKLADLGLAKRVDDTSNLTGHRQGVGTPHYMPYEQVVSARQVDARCDIFALGATLYHLVTGEVPFAGNSPLEIAEKKLQGTYRAASALNPDVPAELDLILGKMLARWPRERYQTASNLIVDLQRSNLAARVPSFISSEAALRDPLVRARLSAAGQPTLPDMQAPVPSKKIADTSPQEALRSSASPNSAETLSQALDPSELAQTPEPAGRKKWPIFLGFGLGFVALALLMGCYYWVVH